MTSRILSLRRPRIGYARLVVAGNVPNQSQGMDYISVIRLGHMVKQPLMWSSGELVDGFEPHDHIYPCPQTHSTLSTPDGQGGGVPGVEELGGYLEGLYRVPPAKARLRLI